MFLVTTMDNDGGIAELKINLEAIREAVEVALYMIEDLEKAFAEKIVRNQRNRIKYYANKL